MGGRYDETETTGRHTHLSRCQLYITSHLRKNRPYSPKGRVEYSYYTTLKGVMEKKTRIISEFVVPAKLKELYNNKDFGRYAMKNGEMLYLFCHSHR